MMGGFLKTYRVSNKGRLSGIAFIYKEACHDKVTRKTDYSYTLVSMNQLILFRVLNVIFACYRLNINGLQLATTLYPSLLIKVSFIKYLRYSIHLFQPKELSIKKNSDKSFSTNNEFVCRYVPILKSTPCLLNFMKLVIKMFVFISCCAFYIDNWSINVI